MKVKGKKLCLSRIHYQSPSLATELPFLISYRFLDGKLTDKDRSQKNESSTIESQGDKREKIHRERNLVSIGTEKHEAIESVLNRCHLQAGFYFISREKPFT
jgi:hypothetical protein